MVIRENGIFKRLKDVVEKALSQFGIKGILVVQANQPNISSIHGVVLISKINVHRYGWQGIGYDKNTGSDSTIKENWYYFDEATYQISAFMPRSNDDTEETVTSYDIVSAIATYLNSYQGIMDMKKSGLQVLRVQDINAPIQQADSDIKQFNPNFEVRFLVFQNPSVTIPTIEHFDIDMNHMKETYPEIEEKLKEEYKEKAKKYSKYIDGLWHGLIHV